MVKHDSERLLSEQERDTLLIRIGWALARTQLDDYGAARRQLRDYLKEIGTEPARPEINTSDV